jgi:hypothetical protein
MPARKRIFRVNDFPEACNLQATFRRPSMIRAEPVVDSSQDVPFAVPGSRRERTVVRRRRPNRRHSARTWAARSSRRKAIRAAALCVGVLLLMAAALYLGLARQDAAPVEVRGGGPGLAQPA